MRKKSITLIGLNKFFFTSIAESQANSLKTYFGQSEQVWMDEKLVPNFAFEIQSSAFVFFKSLNLSPLNSKSLKNSSSITCRVRRKVIRKDLGNVTKNGKALLAKIHEICCEEI